MHLSFRKLLLTLLSVFLFSAVSTAANAQFGAFAAAQDGSYGWSSNYNNVDDAQDRALSECRKHAQNCQIFRVFQNVCVTLARNERQDRPFITWVSGYTRAERERRAVDDCRNLGGSDCRVLQDFCVGNASN
ncbi:MAG: DUF4189 domain-containing protein [Xanthobacteraceae bacterium]|nr:DUF4189 domain-containing protein [Xanthobacteraceae bacterium]QYK44120.1 MAG: DUF4189 domain-containing protein [Xanthobacteraceae bacterium]HMN51085.1 DUF4189 domain-containing protein [Xanthobacteraceae bacterium]